mmetsp:Transcript_45245/g.84465  ORF Transcript_45245/g.84465 Transcript_45245/m.84465 type:complete len:125 (+) Transcript_45245:609-983(+)
MKAVSSQTVVAPKDALTLKSEPSLVNGDTSKSTAGLRMVQAHWQNNAETVAQGVLRGSSVILDEKRSGLNHMLAQKITQGDFGSLNLVEVDNVCDGGLEVSRALKGIQLHMFPPTTEVDEADVL